MKRPKIPNPVTWDVILEYLAKPSNCDGRTNRQIADDGGFSYVDVSLLTRIMWKAGQVSRAEVPNGSRKCMRYYQLGRVP